MEIKAFYQNPDDIPVTIQATMTAGQWKELRQFVLKGHKESVGYSQVAIDFDHAITNATWKLSQYTQPDTQDA